MYVYTQICFLFVVCCLFFETGFLCVAMAVLELCRPGWPQTQKSACLCLTSAWTKGVRYHCPVCLFVCLFFIELIVSGLMTTDLAYPAFFRLIISFVTSNFKTLHNMNPELEHTWL